MATMTYYIALAFKRSEDGGDVVACDPKQARSSEQAIEWLATGSEEGIAEPSRSLGQATRLLATSMMR